MGNKPLDAEKTLIGLSSSISNNQNDQPGRIKFNPKKSKSRFSEPAVLPTLLYFIVSQSDRKIPPRCVTWSTCSMAQTERRAANSL